MRRERNTIAAVTSSAEIDRLFAAQLRRRAGRPPTSAEARIDAIRRLERAVLAAREDIRRAMWEDYRKPPREVEMTEIYAVMSEARHARRRLRRWMRPKRARATPVLIGTRSRVHYEPKGVVLIMSPWNFPFNLSLGPLVSAVAAGNSVIIKPSELAPASSACIRAIVARVFAEEEAAVIEGGPATGEALLRKPFDHIFFTGSPRTGRLVMQAAAEHLASVTLELGGKSPVIVERTADIARAAARIVWGKFLNAGQVCIAPDYALVDESIHDAFVAAVRREVEAIPADARSWIVNDHHAERVRAIVESAKARGAEVVTGGAFHGRSAEPTVIARVPLDSPAMEEEIFGPVLPVVSYRSLDEALEIIAARPKPLVLYIFSRDRPAIDTILTRTSAGGTVINHTMIHFYQLNLPFGGAGGSGMGRAHGAYGFEAFSNVRGVLEQRTGISGIEWIAPPPFTRAKDRLVDLLVRYL